MIDIKITTPCNGIKKKRVAIPINDDTPISCHNKYVNTIV